MVEDKIDKPKFIRKILHGKTPAYAKLKDNKLGKKYL